MMDWRLKMNWFEKNLSGHIGFNVLNWRIVIYGFNAMHVGVNIRTKRWGWVCFHPTMFCFGKWWQWKFYLSPDATPQSATFAIGPGIYHADKIMSKIHLYLFGHNFAYGDDFTTWNRQTRDTLEHLHALNRMSAEELEALGYVQAADPA